MIKLFKFDQVPLPVYKEVKGKEYVYYGEKNDYPNYLLRIYNNSAKNNAIITGKVDYICGNGWTVKAEDEMQKAKAFGLIDRINTKEESLNELTKKLVTDLSIFGGYYLQVIWTKGTGEIAELYHVDYYKVRTNLDNSEFYVSDSTLCFGMIAYLCGLRVRSTSALSSTICIFIYQYVMELSNFFSCSNVYRPCLLSAAHL